MMGARSERNEYLLLHEFHNRKYICPDKVQFQNSVAVHDPVEGEEEEQVTKKGGKRKPAYAGGLADVCPVGSLTTKDFRFKKRVWYLKTAASICDGCSQGCNITVSHDAGLIYRLEPRENQEVNKWWMCDEGRYGFHHVHSPSRVMSPTDLRTSEMKSLNWSEASNAARELLKSAKSIGLLVAADATLEEVVALKKSFPQGEFFSFSNGVDKSAEDKATDHLLRRKDKSPNLRGLEEAGFKPFSSFDPKNFDLCVFVSAGKVRLPYGIAKLAKKSIGMGLFFKEEITGLNLLLPACSTYEKAGTFVNQQGKKQCFAAAVQPVGMSRPLENILSALSDGARKVG